MLPPAAGGSAPLPLRGALPPNKIYKFVWLTPRFGFDENAAVFLVYNRVLGVPRDHPDGTRPRHLRAAPRAAVLSSKIRRIFCEFCDCFSVNVPPAHKTNFNPFRLAAAYASCSPPSPASGDGSYDDRAFSAALRFKSLRTYATNNGIGSETARFSDGKARFGSGRSVSGRR